MRYARAIGRAVMVLTAMTALAGCTASLVSPGRDQRGGWWAAAVARSLAVTSGQDAAVPGRCDQDRTRPTSTWTKSESG
jgi:hypothetical protein